MEFVGKELEYAFHCGVDEFLIVNCSNIKPHVYPLDCLRVLWMDGGIDAKVHRKQYVTQYYGTHVEEIAECFSEYADCMVPFGEREDEHAGEQFYNYTVRQFVHHIMKGEKVEPVKGLLWLNIGDENSLTISKQVSWFRSRMLEAKSKMQKLYDKCGTIVNDLSSKDSNKNQYSKSGNTAGKTLHRNKLKKAIDGNNSAKTIERNNSAITIERNKSTIKIDGNNSAKTLDRYNSTKTYDSNISTKTLLLDSIWIQVKIHLLCVEGAISFCDGFHCYEQGELKEAFYHMGIAAEKFQSANDNLRSREHGKWKDFYANDCLCDIKQTAYVLRHLMGYLRNLGDGPHFYEWQREIFVCRRGS